MEAVLGTGRGKGEGMGSCIWAWFGWGMYGLCMRDSECDSMLVAGLEQLCLTWLRDGFGGGICMAVRTYSATYDQR